MKLTAKVLSVALVLFVTLSFVPGFGLRAFAEGDPAIDKANMNLALSPDADKTGTLTLSNVPEGASVSWAVSDANKATIPSEAGTASVTGNRSVTVTAAAEGDTTVTATITPAGEGTPVTKSCTVKVLPTMPSINITDASKDITIGSSETLAYTVSPASEVTWTSSDQTNFPVANATTGTSASSNSVSAAGTATADQTATITAKITVNGIDYTDTCTVTAKAATPTVNVTSVKIKDGTTELTEGQEIEVAKGSNKTLTPVVTVTPNEDANKGVNWSISPEDTKVTLANGTVTVTDNATVGDVYTITATSEKDTSKKATCKVKVKSATTPTTKTYSLSKLNVYNDLYKNKVDSYNINDLVTLTASSGGLDGVSVKEWAPLENGSVNGNTYTPNSAGTAKIGAKLSNDTTISPGQEYKVYAYVDKEPKTREYVKGTKTPLSFKIGHSGNNEKAYNMDAFNAAGNVVYVNGAKDIGKLVYQTQFTAMEGSVDIILNGNFLETLDVGEYYLTAQFLVTPDGNQRVNSDIIKFTVKSAGSGKNPNTADYLYIGLGIFMFLLALIYVALFTYDKKQRKLRLRRRMAHRRYY